MLYHRFYRPVVHHAHRHQNQFWILHQLLFLRQRQLVEHRPLLIHQARQLGEIQLQILTDFQQAF